MKRQWQTEELVEQFTLLPDEIALLDNKVGVNRLGFAVLFKFFQLEARFPRSKLSNIIGVGLRRKLHETYAAIPTQFAIP